MIIVSIRYVHNPNERVADPEIPERDIHRNGAFFRNDKKEFGYFGLQFFSFTHMKNFWQKVLSKFAIVNIILLCCVWYID
jgi:hypothetical protein